MNCNCVIVAGYYYSGSGAVVDLLKEYDGAFEPGVEFRLIKDPYGLNDLRYNIIEHWDPLNTDNAIKDFLWLAYHLNYPYSKLSLVKGSDYSNMKAFGKRFMEETLTFVDSITDFTYDGTWFFTEFKQTKFERLKEKMLRFIKKQPKNSMYFSHLPAEEFDRYATEYIEKLMGLNTIHSNSFAVLDQGLAAQNPENINHFFKNAKMIIVDRDPRDIYTEMLSGVGLIGQQLQQTHDTQLFIKWFKAYRSNIYSDEKIMRLRFEDVIINHEETVRKIEGFLGFDSQSHISPRKYLQTEVSKTNIGKWKYSLTKDELLGLEELKEFFWTGN